MSRTSRPAFVEVYFAGQSTKLESRARMKYEEAVVAVEEGRGIFRDHRRKIVLAEQPHEPSESCNSRTALSGGSRTKGDGGDMHAIAGTAFSAGYLTRRQRERLSGWGLVEGNA
jgi:hypothetical protein